MTAFIEMVPTDTVKYELDKVSGYHPNRPPAEILDRSARALRLHPAELLRRLGGTVLHGALRRTDILGDGDPLDVCVLTERTISHGDIIASVKPIGGFRMIDRQRGDDKIIAVLQRRHSPRLRRHNRAAAHRGRASEALLPYLQGTCPHRTSPRAPRASR